MNSSYDPKQVEALLAIDVTFKKLVAIDNLYENRHRPALNASDAIDSSWADMQIESGAAAGYNKLEIQLKEKIQEAEKLGLAEDNYVKTVRNIAFSS